MAAVRLVAGRQDTVHIIWHDPLGQRVAKFAMKIEAAWIVTYHKPKLELPIRPGVWTVSLELPNDLLLMKTKFLVVPMTHHNKEVLGSPQVVNAKHSLTVEPNSLIFQEEYTQWKENVSKSGLELEEWMDSLVKDYWTIDNYCRMDAGQSGGEQCTWVQDCASTSWSTFSPDPKTEIGEIRTNGRIR